MQNKVSQPARLFLIVIILILYAPIIYLVFYSFNSGGSMSGFDGFTLDWYRELLGDTRLLIIVLNTFVIALLSALFATIIGIFGAIWIHQLKRSKTSILGLNNILMVSPDVIMGASFLILFTVAGIRLGFYSVLLSHIAFSVPIVVLMILPKLMEMNPALIDAARDLGASRWDVFTKVIIPSINPGIFTGFFMALTYSLDDFAVTFFVTGNGFSMLSIEIYSMARQGISLHINALSTLLFVFTILLVGIYYYLSQRGGLRLGGVRR